MEQILRIDTSGEIYIHRAEEITLDRLQQLVGGYIEVVHPVGLVAPYVMVVDEEGRCKEKPINRIATYIYNCKEPIVGNVIIMAEGQNKSGENDIIGLDDRQTETLWRYLMGLQQNLLGKEKCPATAATVTRQEQK